MVSRVGQPGVRPLPRSVSEMCFAETQMSDGYIFNAATNLIQPRPQPAAAAPTAQKPPTEAPARQPRASAAARPCRVTLGVEDDARVTATIAPAPAPRVRSFEAPAAPIAAAFLARAASKTSSTELPHPKPAAAAPAPADPADALQQYSTDLVPYYLCQYELQGMAISAHRVPPDAPPAPKDSSLAMLPGFAKLAVPLLKGKRPSLREASAAEIRVEMRPVDEVLRAACEARLGKAASAVSLHDLMYDDAFVHSLVNWQQQPSKQLVSMLKWLFHELAALHGRGAAHGALSMRTVTRHPSAGWALAAAPDTPGATKAADAKALARLTAFLCMSSEQRREYQPHHLPTLSDADLRGALQHAPVVQLLVAGLLEGNVTPGDALGYHFWHPLAVHAQVLQDTKAVMRSMRLGSEDFDRAYGALVMGGREWCGALGETLIPAVVAASREHVLRADFAPYDYASAASLLRFTANTVGHFEELGLGLQVTKAAFLAAIVSAFPVLVPACYHFLAAHNSQHVHNRDSTLVFDAIEGDVDGTHRLMHAALAGYIQGRLWRLAALPGFADAAGTGEAADVDPELAREWAEQRCPVGPTCAGLASGACTKWHDGRELRFAKQHLCREWLAGTCTRAACPNAHGFGEIRGAMNDASPICWKWLEGRCRLPHCKYSHTFRRHHGVSMDARRSSVSRSRNSITAGPEAARRGPPPPRASNDFGARRKQASARNSLDASGQRRASFGHSRASIEGVDGGDWRRGGGVPELSAARGVGIGGLTGASPLRQSLEIHPPGREQTAPAPAAAPPNGSRNYAMDGAFTRQAKVVPSRPHANGAPAGVTAAARESLEVARACLQSAYADASAGSSSSNGMPPQRKATPPSLSTASAGITGRSNVSRW